ncbi:MAG TPA: O-methyltransferase [Mycobacteriales bacterium]|jgi:predicted O-methyltransferase YrrM|nr:O-methyltransferase [Mycobacteriales bacterium]
MGSLEASWEYAERFVPEDPVLITARRRADEVGCTPVGPGAGAALRLIASLVGAKSVIELGTGTGVSGVWLLRGMRADGVLTSVDSEAEHQRLARTTFDEAGFAGGRVRLINGAALEVLPRFTDGAYDLVLADAARAEYAGYLEEARRLLRPGGVVVFNGALGHRVADESVSDAGATALRTLGAGVLDDEGFVPALLAAGEGLLVAVKR